MNQPKSLAILTGFVMGVWMGIMLEFGFVFLYNLFCRWQTCAMIPYPSWKLLPFPLLLGISMARAIPQLPLGD